MDNGELISWISLGISIGALIISVLSFILSLQKFNIEKKIAEYDYRPRLEYKTEDIDKHRIFNSPKRESNFISKITITNKGGKPIRIHGAYIVIGSGKEFQQRTRILVGTGGELSPGNHALYNQHIDRRDVERVVAKYALDHCAFFFHLQYEDYKGKKISSTIPLIATRVDGKGSQVYISSSRILVPNPKKRKGLFRFDKIPKEGKQAQDTKEID